MKNIIEKINHKIIKVMITTIICLGLAIAINACRNSPKESSSSEEINDLILLAYRSRMLATNWVYLSPNHPDKNALKKIINIEYPAAKKKALDLIKISKDRSSYIFEWDTSKAALIENATIRFDTLLSHINKNIIGTLKNFEDYEDSLTKLLAEEDIDRFIIPESDSLIKVLYKIKAKDK